MPNIYFWRNALGDHDLLTEHQDTIKQLLSGDYASADLEKLSGHNIYSFRLNGKSRLLFTDHVVDDKNYLLILEYLPNHEYGSSSFLKKGVLAHYRDRKAETLTAEARAIEASFAPTAEKPLCLALRAEDSPQLKAIPLNYFHDQFIELSAIQEEAHRVTLPLVLSGIAGSGKSSTLLSLAIEQALSLNQPVLYVAQSTILLDEMVKNWQQHPSYNPELILFKTYEDLFQIEAPINEPAAAAVSVADDESHDTPMLFATWYSLYLEHELQLIKTRTTATSAPVDNTLSLETAGRELRICSGYSREAYINIGQKNSALNPNQRAWLYTCYEAYMTYLQQKHLTDSALQKPVQKPPPFCRVFVDEAHDFSQVQLEALHEMAENNAVVYCIDSHQMLYDAISNRAHLMQRLFDKLKRQPSHIELPISYRCPANIAQAVDVIIDWKQRVLGLTDKFEARTLTPSAEGIKSPGQLHVISQEKPSPEVIKLIQEHAQTIDFAVVTTEENRRGAATWLKKYGMKASRIFTPEEIKGLEYNTILVLDMFSDKSVFDRINKSSPVTEATQAIHRRRKDKTEVHTECHDAQFIHVINGLIVAFTRATKTLVLCNDSTYFNNVAMSTLNKSTLPTPIEPLAPTIKSSSADFLQRAIELYDRRLLKQSEGIFDNHLDETDRKNYSEYKKTKEQSQAAQAAQAARSTLNPASSKSSSKKTAEIKAISLINSTTATTATAGTCQVKPSVSSPGIKKATQNSHIEATSKKPTFKLSYEQVKKSILKQQPLDSICERINENLDTLINEKSQQDAFITCLIFEPFKTAILKTTIRQSLSTHEYLKTDRAIEIHNLILNICTAQPEFLLEDDCYKLCLSLGKMNNLIINFKKCLNDINHKSSKNDDKALIHLAAWWGDSESVKLLHELGANLQLKASDGRTPAYIAAQEGHANIITALHLAGVENLNQPNRHGATPVLIAAKTGHANVITALHQAGVKNLNQPWRGETPALIAAINGHANVITALHLAGVENLNQPNRNGITPVLFAAINDHANVITALHKAGVKDLNQATPNIGTPVYTAAIAGHANVITALHQAGVKNLNQPTNDGTTPASIAAQKGYLTLSNLLLKLEAEEMEINETTQTPETALTASTIATPPEAFCAIETSSATTHDETSTTLEKLDSAEAGNPDNENKETSPRRPDEKDSAILNGGFFKQPPSSSYQSTSATRESDLNTTQYSPT